MTVKTMVILFGRGSKVKKKMGFLIFLTIFTFSQTSCAEDPDMIIFETKYGPVTFFHNRHKVYVCDDCTICHHMKRKKIRQACRNCHKKKLETREENPPSFYDIKMKLCRGCHRAKRDESEGQKAPVNCEECHNTKAIKFQ